MIGKKLFDRDNCSTACIIDSIMKGISNEKLDARKKRIVITLHLDRINQHHQQQQIIGRKVMEWTTNAFTIPDVIIRIIIIDSTIDSTINSTSISATTSFALLSIAKQDDRHHHYHPPNCGEQSRRWQISEGRRKLDSQKQEAEDGKATQSI